jgi:methylenetetrahydrofolate--tRNA-(uracil-5-)-methyltransferase
MPDLMVVGGGLAGSGCPGKLRSGLRSISTEAPSVPTKHMGISSQSWFAQFTRFNSYRPLIRLLEKPADGFSFADVLRNCTTSSALAVDREAFASRVTEAILSHPNIAVIREEVTEIPDQLTIIASGPLTSKNLSDALVTLTGSGHLFFFDAIAPIVSIDSVNMEIIYPASRYARGKRPQGDYLNCPLDEDEYNVFVDALCNAQRVEIKEFEVEIDQGVTAGVGKFFEGCLPVEILARRGRQTLAYGPLRPVGLIDPHSGERPYAAVQLRQDNLAGSLYNLVGFQTNLTFSEQRRVFRLIPGLEAAEFIRYGQMHRNTFIYSPELLKPTLQCNKRGNLFFAGQLTGVEGYAGNIATGLLAGMNAARIFAGQEPVSLPETTLLGALCRYITRTRREDYQPMKANFGLLPPLTVRERGKKLRSKRDRGAAYASRSLNDLNAFLTDLNCME